MQKNSISATLITSYALSD